MNVEPHDKRKQCDKENNNRKRSSVYVALRYLNFKFKMTKVTIRHNRTEILYPFSMNVYFKHIMQPLDKQTKYFHRNRRIRPQW